MALKPDRCIDPFGTETNMIFNGTADAGTIMVYSTAGSGNLTADQNVGAVQVGPLNPSGAPKVVGLLLNPFVTFNPLLHRNIYKVTQWPGEKATLLRRGGWVTTNVLDSGAVPDAGKQAYLGASGVVTDNAALGGQRLGEFMGRLDEYGYCRLAINLP